MVCGLLIASGRGRCTTRDIIFFFACRGVVVGRTPLARFILDGVVGIIGLLLGGGIGGLLCICCVEKKNDRVNKRWDR